MAWLKRTTLGILLFFVQTELSAATYQQAVQFSYALVSSEPSSLNGFQLFWQWQQKDLFWRRFQLIFDIGLSHFEHPHSASNNELTIVSAAPILRYYFRPRNHYQLYLDVSIGVAYLNHTQMEERNLGVHFGFQDRIGAGLLFGDKKQYSLGVHAVHYSNASISKHNSGVSVPLSVDFTIKI